MNKENYKNLAEFSSKEYVDLIKWLYDNHKEILREYEKTKGKVRIDFLDKLKDKKESNGNA